MIMREDVYEADLWTIYINQCVHDACVLWFDWAMTEKGMHFLMQVVSVRFKLSLF